MIENPIPMTAADLPDRGEAFRLALNSSIAAVYVAQGAPLCLYPRAHRMAQAARRALRRIGTPDVW